MRKILRGLKYNTSTAQLVGRYLNEDCFLTRIEECLFLKRTGEYFLYVQGGMLSKYSINDAWNKPKDGEQIIPITKQQARDWAEDRLTKQEAIEIFKKPPVPPKDEMFRVDFQIERQGLDKLKRIAMRKKISASELLRRLVDSIPD